jgi:hypothetical protein
MSPFPGNIGHHQECAGTERIGHRFAGPPLRCIQEIACKDLDDIGAKNYSERNAGKVVACDRQPVVPMRKLPVNTHANQEIREGHEDICLVALLNSISLFYQDIPAFSASSRSFFASAPQHFSPSAQMPAEKAFRILAT